MRQLEDSDLFPFGTHKGTKMQEVPATYLDWLRDQPWVEDWPDVVDYLRRHEKVIDKELEELGIE